MYLPIFATICGLAATTVLAAATPACHEDNCLRAIQASAFTERMGAADCSAYLLGTVTAAVVTSTTTVTAIDVVTSTFSDFNQKREATASPTTVTPATIPAYASACSGAVRYSSACACIGVMGSITTAPASTVTATATTTRTFTEDLIYF